MIIERHMKDDQKIPKPFNKSLSETTNDQSFSENDSYYQRLVSESSIPFCVCDTGGVITFYNRAAHELWGTNPVPGKDIWHAGLKIARPDGKILPADELPTAVAIMKRENVPGTELLIERGDGLRRTVLFFADPVTDAAGNITGVSGTMVDLTQHANKSSMDTVPFLSSEDRYHKMIEEVEDYAILMLDQNGIVVNWNKGAQKIKGYRAEEIVGKNFSAFYLESDRVNGLPARLLQQARESGRALHEGWRMRKDGSNFWGSVAITALHNDRNEVIGYTKVTRDLTERKKAEEELNTQASELLRKNWELERSNDSLEQFAYVSSHDLQEPLRKIRTFSDLILTRINDPGFDPNLYLNKINSSANRMSLLINDLLNFSRLNKADGFWENVNLEGVLDAVINDFELLIKQKNAVIRRTALPTIAAIPIQMNQLFFNMISNALKFTDTSPEIEISAEILSQETIRGMDQLDTRKNYLHLTFKDNGIGFDQSYAQQIFTIFQRLNNYQQYSGTGIGLAICKKIVDNHGGYIAATSEPGKGAAFDVYLPIQKTG